MMKIAAFVLFLAAGPLAGQSNSGELVLSVAGPEGRGLRVAVRLVSEANQYQATLETSDKGELDILRLPYGTYSVEIRESGFAPFEASVSIRSSLPLRRLIELKLSEVNQTVTVNAADTLIDPEQPGTVNRIGADEISHRAGSIPGRSIQDLVNSLPGWLYEGNAVLHPRGSEYQTQFVVDGIPLTDNRSPSFGPEIEADDVQSMAVYTAGFPAEFGRKMGGVVEVNTVEDAQTGLHGRAVLSGGSFATAGAFAKGQYTWGRNTLGASANGNRTDHYLNPVVPENYSNTGTLGDFAARFDRAFSATDRASVSIRHELSRYDIPNEQVQQAAGQRETADNIETMGLAGYAHNFSSQTMGEVHGMVRDNANDFDSNTQSTPIEVFQHNRFREGYLKAAVTMHRGNQEWRLGVESDNTFLHENLNYVITDPSRFDAGTPRTFTFAGDRPDLEQSAFVEDRLSLGNWTASAGLRWDHYQLLLNRQAIAPRLSVARYLPKAAVIMHFSYDRVFQTPSFENLLLSSSAAVESIDPANFLRRPVQPSQGDYFEGGLTKAFLGKVRLDVNTYRRVVDQAADDDQIDNTSISFPIAFSKSIVYGAEGKLDLPDWRRVSGFLSYSWQMGSVWLPVTGGLFLGSNATTARTDLSGHLPDSQDQRNTLRARIRWQAQPRLWIAAGFRYDSGLPFEFDGDPATAMEEYGQRVLDRINFSRGRIKPALLMNAMIGAQIWKSDRATMQLQADGENITDLLDVIDFGGLFSGNAIGTPRSFGLRLTTTF